ncbi:hypothetical protein [Mycoplasma sp. Ms02]|nr:hypothetical protein [Mycoplasma sp. Ms02]QZE12458.1 hypothetical protein K4L35_00490 [Mycoplasma sp. Ms02]
MLYKNHIDNIKNKFSISQNFISINNKSGSDFYVSFFENLYKETLNLV